MGALSLGLGTPGLIAGIACLVLSVFNIYALCVNENLSAQIRAEGQDFKAAASDAAYNSAKTGASSGAQYLRDNPDQARKAAQFAAENPAIRDAAISAAMKP